MFIDPKLISADALEALVSAWVCQQDFSSSDDFEINIAVTQIIGKLQRKELILTFSDNDELDETDRWSIQPCEHFNLTPSQVECDSL